MRRAKLLVTMAWLAALPLAAQTPLEEHPGFFPIEEVGLAADELEIEVNLRGAMLRLVGSAMAAEDPEFAGLMAALEAVRVQVGTVAAGEAAELRQRLAGAARRLADGGWSPVVKVREDGEEIYIFARETDGEVAGMTFLALEDEEVTLINLVGNVGPELLEGLGQSMDLPQLLRATGEEGAPPEDGR